MQGMPKKECKNWAEMFKESVAAVKKGGFVFKVSDWGTQLDTLDKSLAL